MNTTPNRLTSIFLYLLTVAVVFAAVVFLTRSEAEYINNPADLNRFDFSQGAVIISPNAFESEGTYRHAFYRITLTNLTPGKIYGISGYSATHAMRLWVDGVLLYEIGSPGDSYDTMTAGTGYFTVYFTAGAHEIGTGTEIVIERSGFVLAHGGRLNSLYFGEQHHITAIQVLSYVRVSFLVGITIMAVLFNLGIFLFFKNQVRFLWFALYCLMIALRTIGIDNRLITTLIPGMSWEFDYLFAYLVTSGFTVFIILFFNAMFFEGLNKWLVRISLGFLGIHAVFMLVTSPAVYSAFNTPYNIIQVVITVSFLVNTRQSTLWLY